MYTAGLKAFVKSTKSRFQTTKTIFMCSLNMVFYLKILNWCVQCTQCDYFMIFQVASTGVFVESYKMQE